jgi:hypothetical protein
MHSWLVAWQVAGNWGGFCTQHVGVVGQAAAPRRAARCGGGGRIIVGPGRPACCLRRAAGIACRL